MKLSILFLYLRMTPERSHKITIYILMGFVVAHEISSLLVRRSFPNVIRRVLNADIYLGRDLSMRTDR